MAVMLLNVFCVLDQLFLLVLFLFKVSESPVAQKVDTHVGGK
jgi:hypothetical protein